jgi:formate dehydrogenase subunit gamma
MKAAQIKHDAVEGRTAAAPSKHILRFHPSERMLHWSLAIPFVVCVATAVVLIVVYNLHPHRAFRAVFAWTHRISGACLILFPLLTAIAHRRDHPLHWRNVREAWTWTMDDVKWLLLMPISAVSGNDELPEQGKFNAAEKLNFMTLTCGYPIFILTGLVLWITKLAFLSWLIHIGMAALAVPLVVGHMYMAIINPSTRVGLNGMFSGYVDREWARHHYALWYREHFEKDHHRKPPQSVEHVGSAQTAEGFD